jgi:hypothetical protein
VSKWEHAEDYKRTKKLIPHRQSHAIWSNDDLSIINILLESLSHVLIFIHHSTVDLTGSVLIFVGKGFNIKNKWKKLYKNNNGIALVP